ncbi:MAG: C40 family peptidase [Desulfobacterales bacterium]|nr:C40 family peptidase [Desulfobacterales bacterium]
MNTYTKERPGIAREDRMPWKRIRFMVRRLTLLPACLVLVAGCARAPSVKPIATEPPLTPSVQRSSVPERFGHGPVGVEDRLRAAAERWAGTPHRMGGSDAGGMDCSGLVRRIYKDLFHIRLPRTTQGQAIAGEPVENAALVPGDLVFFRIPEKKLRHVGIYLGRGEFVHASTSLGVTISDLANLYWKKAYWTARRIL